MSDRGGSIRYVPPTPDEVAAYLQRARELRSETIVAGIRALLGGLRHAWRASFERVPRATRAPCSAPHYRRAG